MPGDVHAVPRHHASGLARDGGEDAHERGFTRAVRSKQAKYACSEFEREIPQPPEITTVLFTDILDG